MIPIPKRDLELMSGGRDNLYDAILDFMIEFHEIDMDKLGRLPLPTFLALAKRMDYRNKQMEKQCRKK